MNQKEIQQKVIQQAQDITERFISAAERPENIYTLDAEQAALVVIDMQNFVCAPEDGNAFAGIDKIIENTNALVDLCHDKKIPVIWVRHTISTHDDNTDGGLYPLFHDNAHLRSVENQAESTEIYQGMHLDENKHHIVLKCRYSAFMPDPSQSELEETLQSLGIRQLIICGMATNVCVESTIRDAMQMDYEVILAKDATDTYDPIVKAITLSELQLLFCDVRSTENIINALIAK